MCLGVAATIAQTFKEPLGIPFPKPTDDLPSVNFPRTHRHGAPEIPKAIFTVRRRAGPTAGSDGGAIPGQLLCVKNVKSYSNRPHPNPLPEGEGAFLALLS
ncbi:hypothetical protein sS8_3613 [Methylocaldum marinum]|uniref:Uncharacterized protein n=1 Tax=Methylocaldum marinum TaxID=1432792 RepID=A0A250KV77_9GAMM|nr:hypothetical protein sS8_3613 [Methylocaldum marinum]